MAARIAVLFLASVVVAAGQEPPRPQPAAPSAQVVLKLGPASILGRIVENGSTTGIANAVVTLSGQALGASSALFSNGVLGGPRRVMTDSQGQFVFRELPAGLYSISVQASGYLDAVYGPPASRPQPQGGTLGLTLTDADKPFNVTVPMLRLGGISGRVVDEAGEPMVGAPVTVYAHRSEWGTKSLTTASRVNTDDRGRYHADVPPGDYLVALIAATTTVPAAAVDGFQQAQRAGGPTFQSYMSEISATGSLLPRGVGARVGNFLVSQFGMQNAWVVPPVYVREGRWFFYPSTFHPNSASLAFALVVTVSSGEEKTGIDLNVRPVPARRVSGRVVGPAGPVGGIALRLVSPQVETANAIWSVSNETPQTITDGNGDFTFIGIAPGPYRLRVLRASQPAEPVLWNADFIAVDADSDLTDLTVRLQSGATIGGRVVIESASPLPAAALKAITIRPTPLIGSASSLMGPAGWVVRPDDNGRFTTGQMVPGRYMIAVSALPAGWIVKTVTVGGQDAIDKPFDLTATGITDVVVTISDKSATLTGVVRNANGQPESGAAVIAFPTDSALSPPPGMASRRIQSAIPLRDGRYTLRDLPAGEYFVVATTWAADFSDPRVRSTFAGDAVRVTIADGETKALDVRALVKR